MGKFSLLLIILLGGISVFAQKNTVVKGFVKQGDIQEVNLYSVVNGRMKIIGTTVPAEDKSYQFSFHPDKPGFHVVGNGVKAIIYVKGGEEINIDLYVKYAELNGKNTKENVELYGWEDFSREIRFSASKDWEVTCKDFFSEFLEYQSKADAYKKKVKSGNKQFDDLLRKKMDYDVDYYAMLYLKILHLGHPKREDWLSFNDVMISGKKFTTDDVLLFPEGFKMMLVYVDFGKMVESTKQGIELLNNDRLRGEYLLYMMLDMSSVPEFDEEMQKYGKYLVTDVQKAKADTIAQKLVQSGACFLNGKPAIDFTYPDVQGKEVSLSDFKGKIILVDFWATWCGPCCREIPYFKKLEEEMRGKDVVFIGVSLDEAKDKQKWLDLVKREDLKGVQLHASGWGKITKDYRIDYIPHFLVIDKKGNVVANLAPRPSTPELKNMIEELLKE